MDPRQVRFQYAKIRPFFSGCGRSVTETLESIRSGDVSVEDLPPIQVLVGPEEEGEPVYFSLNNRRLWVLKRLREEGGLKNDVVRVRWRDFKSQAEVERCHTPSYTLTHPDHADTSGTLSPTAPWKQNSSEKPKRRRMK